MSNELAIAIGMAIVLVPVVIFAGLIIWAERDSIRSHPGEDTEHGGRPL